MVSYNGLKHTKDVLLSGLRSFFNNTSNYKHLLPEQIPESAFLNMNIYDTHPQSLRTFPMIVLAQSGGRYASHSIGNDFASEMYNDEGQLEGYLYLNFYDFSFEVEVGTKTTLEREVLMDITASALRWSLRRRMEYYGVIVREVTYGGENKIQYDSDFIYTSMINVQTYSEWTEYYKLLPITEVKSEQEVINPYSQEEKSNKSWYIPRESNINFNQNGQDASYHMYDRSKKYFEQLKFQYQI